MRILAIADEEAKKYWDYYKKGMLDDIDLIVSCGDLDPRYLSFLATFTHAPVIYIHGNHDEKYERISPDGCDRRGLTKKPSHDMLNLVIQLTEVVEPHGVWPL